MATRVSPPQNKTYYINPAYLTFVENSGYGANLIQVSASSSCYISVYDPSNGIGYSDADRNYQRWKVTAYNNKFPNDSFHYIYVRLERNGTSALVIYDAVLRGVKGGEVTVSKDENGNDVYTEAETTQDTYWYIKIGEVGATDGTSIREITYDTGYLMSDQGAIDAGGLNEMWELDKYSTPWLIRAKQWLTNFTVKGFITLIGGLIFKKGETEKIITDIKRSTDSDEDVPISDESIPTTKYIADQTDKKYLRKDKNDRSVGQIASDVGFEAGEFVPEATGAACYQDKDGNWHIETDHLRVRKKAIFTEVEVQEVHHVGGQMLLTAANMIVNYVFEMEDRYRCYFLKKDSDGREVKNLWKTGDQAYCNTFNLGKQADGTLGNHYLWRLVVGTNLDTKDDAETRTFGDVTISTADYNFADLSKHEYGGNSDVPKPNDEIVQLGYQPKDDAGRRNAILIAGAGSGSPYIYEFTGIEWFELPEPETQIRPGNNVFTGKMHIQPGSTGADSLTDLPDEIFKAAQIGAVNLLLNSGFTGNYQTEDLKHDSRTESDLELYSKNFLYWSGEATLNEDKDSQSGYSASIGILEQELTLIDNEFYVVSFKARGKQVKVYVGNTPQTVTLTSEYQRYALKYSFTHEVIGRHRFRIEGDATVCDLQLERGTIATDWKPSPLDNDKSFAEFQSLYYLSDALKHGSTTILNGLVLSSVIQLGNYLEGKMQKVNAGMSGIYHDDEDVAFWGGGTFEQAIRTVMKFKQNPRYRPTDAEWKDMANFVVSHGGDIFMRGYIHALGGYFRGAIHADSGIFYNVKSPSGSFEIDKDGNVNITGKFQTSIEGNRIVINPETKSISLYDELGRETVAVKFYGDVGESWTYGNVHLRRYQQDSNNVVMENFITPSQVDIIDYISKYETHYRAGYVQMVSTDGKNAEIALGMSRKSLSDDLLSDYNWITNLRLGQLPESIDDVAEGGVYSDEGVLKIKPKADNT